LVLLEASLSLLSPMIVSVLARVIVDGIRVAAAAAAARVCMYIYIDITNVYPQTHITP